MVDRGMPLFSTDDEALKWLIMRKIFDPEAAILLGIMYEEGLGVERSDQKALSLYRTAADQGHAVAQNNLGFMYYNGKCVPQSHEEAAKWYLKAAEQGNA